LRIEGCCLFINRNRNIEIQYLIASRFHICWGNNNFANTKVKYVDLISGGEITILKIPWYISGDVIFYGEI
jgi:hypothetical protein